MPKLIAQQVCFAVFRLSFYALATVIALLMVFGTPGVIKQSFVSTQAYTRFVPSIFAAQSQSGQSQGTVPLGDPEIQDIIQHSFPPETMQRNMELVVDRTYAWLNGQTKEPDFVVDFTPNVDYMADQLSNYARKRLRSQPVCQTPPTEINPFADGCQPEFFDFDQAQTELAAAIRANNGILPKVTYTVNDLPKTTDGERLIDQYAYAPAAFQALRYAPGILVGTTLLSGLYIVYLARRKREAVHWLGTNAVTSGLFIVLSPLFYMYVLPRFFPGLSMGASSDITAVFGDVITKITTVFNTSLVLVGLAMTLVGAAVVTLERATRPKSKYIHLSTKAGLMSSEKSTARPRPKRSKARLSPSDVPIQTSEGVRNTGKYQKDKSYRKIHAKEF